MRRASTSARLVRAGGADTRIIGTPGAVIITRGAPTTITVTIMRTATAAITTADIAATTATFPPTITARHFTVGRITHGQRQWLTHGDGAGRRGTDTMATTSIRIRSMPARLYG